MSLCYRTECDMIDRESFYIRSSRKPEKGRDIGKRTSMDLSPLKIVFNHITFDEQIQEQYLCDVW